MPYFTLQSEADFTIDEIWDECSKSEKIKLMEFGASEGFISNSQMFNPTTHTEHEIARLLSEIWENKLHMETFDVDAIRASLKEKNIL